MGFWVISVALALASVGLLVRAVLARRAESAASDVPGIGLYREQLAAVGADAEAGRIDAGEAARLELEIKRRILEADRAAAGAGGAGRAPRAVSLGLAAGLALLVVGLSFGLYVTLGAPGYRDAPIATRLAAAEDFRANRPRQEAAAARYAASLPNTPDPQVSEEFRALMAQLREAVAGRPDDLQGHVLLVRNEAAMGNLGAAAEAQEAVLRIKGEAAEAQDFVLLAELWITEAGGYVSPEAEAVLAEALRRDGENMTARYYWGLMRAQTGRADLAFNVWRSVEGNVPEGALWGEDLPRQMAAAAQAAGVDYTPRADVRGPSAADMEAAQDMSEEDRAAMVQGMVEGLAEELASEGGPPEKWAQLVRALGVLGQRERQAEILSEAREVFAGNDEAIAMIEAAAGAGE